MTLLALITSPLAYHSLLTEIQHAAATVSNPISHAQTQELPYLKAVIREGMRMWPPVSGLGFKLVPPEGDFINGYAVPGGTQVGQGFHGVGRSKAIWGEDADCFRPERWLVASEGEYKRMVAAADTHFGGGKYSCLGKPIALMELHKSVFEVRLPCTTFESEKILTAYQLLRRYDMSLINPERPIKIESSVFLSASDLWVKITKRDR